MHSTDTRAFSTSDLKALVPAVIVAAAAFLGGMSSLYAAPARGEMAVVFAPWVTGVDAYRTILAAGGQFVANSRFENIAIAYASDDGFKGRVVAAGALLLLSATGICGPVAASSSSSQDLT